MINFVKYRKWYFLFSGVALTIGVIAMVISTRIYPEHSIVRLGIDFVGGSIFEANFKPIEGKTPGVISGNDLAGVFTQAGLSDISVQRLGLTDTYQWQVRSSFGENNPDIVQKLVDGLNALAAKENLSFDSDYLVKNRNTVSAAVGSEVTNAAFIATLAASLLVLAWIAFAFRQVKNAFRYGVCAVVSMLHDALVMLGLMSILGLLVGWEADSLFLTAFLTVIGYSVQDTIVTFDRIRENDVRHRGEPFELIVNRSMMEMIQRSVMTQIAVAFVLLSLFLIGGGAIHQFVGVLVIGLISGTYSSICIAVPLLISWDRGEIPFVNQKARQAATA
jgi:preprotein translocase SecF subunit